LLIAEKVPDCLRVEPWPMHYKFQHWEILEDY